MDISEMGIKDCKDFEFKYDNEDGSDIVYTFHKCYKIDFRNDIDYDKEKYEHYCNSYYIQDIKFEEINHENFTFYNFIMGAYPLTLEILCKNIEINQVFRTPQDVNWTI
jgi:hypothetical protein